MLALRDRDRDPGNRDIDNEAQGLAAQAEARREQCRRQRGARSAHRLERAAASREAASTVPGNDDRLVGAAPEGPFVALTIGKRAAAAVAGAGWRWRRR